jgi:transposase
MAVERVREGESASQVIEAYGFNRTTIYKWIQAALRPGVGIKALRSTKATGRPRSLTPRQEWQVFRWVNGRDDSSMLDSSASHLAMRLGFGWFTSGRRVAQHG